VQETDDVYSRGIDNLACGRFPEAVADFTQAIKLDPQCANAYRLRGVAHKNLGETARAEADYTKARQLGFPGKQ
jgi:tetratricopeptide (TPR) repeat protein